MSLEFYDKRGRDMVVHDWLKRYSNDHVKLYETLLNGYKKHEPLNQLVLLAFEAGIAFATMKNEAATEAAEDSEDDYYDEE